MRSMRDRRLFVQFMHPGGEHVPDRDGLKGWNTGPHRRKFLTAPGRYLEAGATRSDELVFWGEWEPQSRVIRTYHDPMPGGPRCLFEPYYTPPASWHTTRMQNTDPFVFGDQFQYTGCLQHTKRGATQLRYLDRGSIILFGSCRDKRDFVIDTVFVVDRWIDHNQANQRSPEVRRAVSSTYGEVTLDPWYAGDVPAERSHRLYFGATPETPVDGMFSFFPCLTAHAAEHGFARPVIRIDRRITPHLLQGKKLTSLVDLEGAGGLWAEVARQVEQQDLKLGVHADLPPREA
jgi:hypothetical protein